MPKTYISDSRCNSLICLWELHNMTSFPHFLLKLNLATITTLTLFCSAIAHSELDRPRMNVIPGKACGLQTEMRYLDALGKYNLI